jgi:hypothetical protein
MKRLTKKYAEELLKEENYMDALAYFATRLLNTKKDPYDELMDLDERMWEIASEGEDEAEEQWLRIYSALQCAM